MKCFAAIDPGSSGSAIAVFSYEPKSLPIHILLVSRASSGSWMDGAADCCKALEMLKEFVAVTHEMDIEKVYCEYPAYFEKGKGAIAAAEGSLVKLSCAVGAVLSTCYHLNIEFIPVPVAWKGMLPKEAVMHRIKKYYNFLGHDIKATSHEWDAIGIGLHVKKELFVKSK